MEDMRVLLDDTKSKIVYILNQDITIKVLPKNIVDKLTAIIKFVNNVVRNEESTGADFYNATYMLAVAEIVLRSFVELPVVYAAQFSNALLETVFSKESYKEIGGWRG